MGKKSFGLVGGQGVGSDVIGFTAFAPMQGMLPAAPEEMNCGAAEISRPHYLVHQCLSLLVCIATDVFYVRT